MVQDFCKTKSSKRKVVITAGLVGVLQEHKAEIMKRVEQSGEGWSESRLVFPNTFSNQGGLHFLLYSEAINSERLIGFMETLIKTSNGRKVYFILDNLKVHHSSLVSQWVDAHKDEIALFHLPPYSPEYNPDEYLNNDLKQSIGSQAMVQDIQE